MWKLKIIICTTLLFIFSDIVCQVDISKHIGVEDGLSNNYITDIAQDGQGFIWIASESGLNRFDGRNFTVFTKNNSDLISNELNTLLYDEEENSIWIGSQRDGLSIFDCDTQLFNNYTIDNGLKTNDITGLSHAKDGGIWITHYHVGIEYYNKKEKSFILFADKDIEGMKSLNWCSCDDGNGNLYVGHTNDGLSIVDIKNKTARNFRHNPTDAKSLPGDEVRTIFIDSKKNIWVGTNRGLALFNPQTEEFITFRHNPSNEGSLGSDRIFNIQEMKDGTLWISTDMSGISILNLSNITLMDPEKVTFQNMTVANNRNRLASSNIRVLFQDSFDNVWIGHYSRGIDFVSSQPSVFQIENYTTDSKKEQNEKQIWDLHIDKNQRLWVGSENEIAVFENNSVKKIINIKSYLPKAALNVYVNRIKSDRNGDIWIGTNNYGILKINPNTYLVEWMPLSEGGEYVHDIYEDINGKIWMGTESGLYSYYNNKITKEEIINDQLSDKTIYSIICDKQGKLWLGTFGKGIFIFDDNNKLIRNIVKENGFISNAINSLYLDSNNYIWAATRNGIACFTNTDNPQQCETYNEKLGLENPYIRAIQEDNSGNMWFSTNGGISLWNKKEARFNNYNHQYGVPIGGFTNGSASIRNDGIVLFGSLSGICYFNPQHLTKDEQVVTPVQIVECVTLNKQIENSGKKILIPSADNIIDLPHNQNSFNISFSNPNYSQNPQVEYAYMMDGLDNNWYNTQGENQVTFRNLSPGKYKFMVKSRLKNNNWNDSHIASLNFVVQPPVWLSWYAKSAYILIICMIVFFMLRSYKRKVDLKTSLELEKKNSQNKQELNDERLRFYTNITHELRTPLTLILGPLDDLVHDPELPASYSKKINIIHASAIRLLNLINQILEFRKTETQNRKLTVSKGNLSNLISEVGLRFKELNQNNDVAIHINIEKKDSILYFDADMIITILNNLLSNAIKYTPSGEICLSIRSVKDGDKQYTEIEVRDTGYGIEAEALPHIFDRYYQAKGKHQSSGTGIGLALVKSMVELHEGILNVESTIGQGTKFSFRLLTDNIYPNALHSDNSLNGDTFEENIEILQEENEEIRSTVLIIEDDKDIREYIQSSLSADYHVFSATNGREGLNMAFKYIPNIIVSDIMMPEMNGIEVCRSIKEDVRTSHIPVILLTAKDSIHDKEEGYDSGADSYLTKPFSARLLHSRISNLLESRRRLAGQINSQAKGEIVKEENPSEDEIKISRIDQEFLNKLTEIIESNIDMEGLDITFIKEKMNMSHSTFYRKVKGLTGISANEFIRKVRLKNSLRFLSTGSYQVSEVAYMSGFNDVAYFRRCFKEEYGMTPSEYLKNTPK